MNSAWVFDPLPMSRYWRERTARDRSWNFRLRRASEIPARMRAFATLVARAMAGQRTRRPEALRPALRADAHPDAGFGIAVHALPVRRFREQLRERALRRPHDHLHVVVVE